VVSFTPLPLYSRGKSPLYSLGPRAGLDDTEKRKLLTLPGLTLRPLGRPARSQSLYRLCYPGSQCFRSELINFHETYVGIMATIQYTACYKGSRQQQTSSKSVHLSTVFMQQSRKYKDSRAMRLCSLVTTHVSKESATSNFRTEGPLLQMVTTYPYYNMS
jgi:hypothetical protein